MATTASPLAPAIPTPAAADTSATTPEPSSGRNRPALLREWSYPPPAATSVVAVGKLAPEETNEPNTTPDVNESRDVVVGLEQAKEVQGGGKTEETTQEEQHQHGELSQQAGTLPQQQQYPVATFVGTLAWNIRSSIDQWIADNNLPVPIPVAPPFNGGGYGAGVPHQVSGSDGAGTSPKSNKPQRRNTWRNSFLQLKHQQHQLQEGGRGTGRRGSSKKEKSNSLRSDGFLDTPVFLGNEPPEDSIRSVQSDGALLHSVTAPNSQKEEEGPSARSWNVDTFIEDDDGEYVIVDGELVSFPVPPPNADEMEQIEWHLRVAAENRRNNCMGPADRNTCGVHNVRRGVGKVRKWMKRRHQARKERMEAKKRGGVNEVFSTTLDAAERGEGGTGEGDGGQLAHLSLTFDSEGPLFLTPCSSSERLDTFANKKKKTKAMKRSKKNKKRRSSLLSDREEDISPLPRTASAVPIISTTHVTPPPPHAFLIPNGCDGGMAGRYPLLLPAPPAPRVVGYTSMEDDAVERKIAENDRLTKKETKPPEVPSTSAATESEGNSSDKINKAHDEGDALTTPSESSPVPPRTNVDDELLREITDTLTDDVIHEDFNTGGDLELPSLASSLVSSMSSSMTSSPSSSCNFCEKVRKVDDDEKDIRTPSAEPSIDETKTKPTLSVKAMIDAFESRRVNEKNWPCASSSTTTTTASTPESLFSTPSLEYGQVFKSYPRHRSVLLMQSSDHDDLMKSTSDLGLKTSICQRRALSEIVVSKTVSPEYDDNDTEEVYNDTLKVVMVGAPGVGKSSIVRLLKEGEDGRNTPTDGRVTSRVRRKVNKRRSTLGVDVHTWTPSMIGLDEIANEGSDNEGESRGSEGHERKIKFSIWDVNNGNGGAHHATQALFFSPNTLYIVVWDMAANNPKTWRKNRRDPSHDAVGDDDDDIIFHDQEEEEEDEDDNEFLLERYNRAADAALERDIDDNVVFWVDTIRRHAGEGAAVLPVASFDDAFDECAGGGCGVNESRRRCDMLRRRLLGHHNSARMSVGSDASSSTLPELIFAKNDEIVRVSSSSRSGFQELRETIMNATTACCGESGGMFRGHLFRKVPTVFIKVLETVRKLRQERNVISVDTVLKETRDAMICNPVAACDVRESLRFLSSTGEILYFGNREMEAIFPTKSQLSEVSRCALSRFVILNQKWLVSAISCIQRTDLKREIMETRRFMNMQLMYSGEELKEDDSIPKAFVSMKSRCPVVTSNDSSMLWQSMNFMREAADDAQSNMPVNARPTLFEYLELLLVHAGIYVPLDMPLPKPLTGKPSQVIGAASNGPDHSKQLYLLPGLFLKEEPSDIWTYKCSDSWMTTLAHCWLFTERVPSDVMEIVTASVLGDLYHFTRSQAEHATSLPQKQFAKSDPCRFNESNSFGHMRVHEITCWKTALLLKLGVLFLEPESRKLKESEVEIFVHLADQQNQQCVASSLMAAGMKRLVVSGKGQVGSHGRKLWRGGYRLVLDSINRVMGDLTGVAMEREIVCPDCLAHFHPSVVDTWSLDAVQSAAGRGQGRVRCHRGHNVDTALLCGLNRPEPVIPASCEKHAHKPISSLLGSVVVVGLWDGRSKRVVNVGSGFIVDRKQGLIVTAGHNLFRMDDCKEFGKPYFGLKEGKAVIGVIPQPGTNGPGGTTAMFRYFAEIVAHDVRNVDACVLRIATRLENDVGGEGEGCAEQPEIPLINDLEALKNEKLQQLKITRKCELEEIVRIIGYNQGGEGLLEPGKHINRSVDFSKGYVCKRFTAFPDESLDSVSLNAHMPSLQQAKLMARGFSPREEIVVMCSTIGGHSGGPCVNQEGSVIGILSRADPADKQRCYLVPASELKGLVRKARARCAFSPMCTHNM